MDETDRDDEPALSLQPGDPTRHSLEGSLGDPHDRPLRQLRVGTQREAQLLEPPHLREVVGELFLVEDGEDVHAEVRLQQLEPLVLHVAPDEEVPRKEREPRRPSVPVPRVPLLAQRKVNGTPRLRHSQADLSCRDLTWTTHHGYLSGARSKRYQGKRRARA